jgi:Zn-dependent protease
LGRDRVFWIVIGVVVLAYLVSSLQLGWGILASLAGLLLAITVHECAHAWAADRLGDPTARLAGRVSLNPLRHLDPLGTVMMVMTVLTGFGIGWGKPVPITPYRLRYGTRLGSGLVALAGPASNLLLATILGLALRLVAVYLPDWLCVFWYLAVFINVLIAFFNLLPIPPLDGYSVLLGLLSLVHSRWAWEVSQFLARLASQGTLIIIGLLIVAQLFGLNLFSAVISPPTEWVARLILGPLY